jgi:hypothetical protein
MTKVDLKHEPANSTNTVLCAVPLPCPFCGAEANKDKVWMDAVFYIQCSNTDCVAQPSISVKAKCVENKGDTITYSPLWEDAEAEAIAKWNTRHCH